MKRIPGWIAVMVCVMPVSASAADTIDMGTQKQLLFDDTLFASKEGFVTTVNPAVCDPEPVLVPSEPWEANRVWWQSSVLREPDGTLRLWYCSFDADDNRYLCLATSKDGTHWTRPALGVIEFGGSKQNNIVFADRSAQRQPQYGTIFKDPVAPPEERYKLIYGSGLLEKIEGTPRYQGIRGAYSPDGIHWNVYPKDKIMPWYTDTQNVAFWDDRLDQYVAYVRINEGQFFDREVNGVGGTFDYRTVGRSQSDDFTSFPAPKKVLETSQEEHEREGGYYGYMDLYNPPMVKLAPDAYYMMPSTFYHYGVSNKMDVTLAVSRDGVDWHLFPDTFIRLGTTGAFDSERIYVLAGHEPITSGEEIWIYYAGFDLDHSGGHKPYPPHFGAIGRARIRLDGFVSQDAPASGGQIVTKPFVVRGNRLFANVDGSAGGFIRVEFLDADGNEIERFSGDDPVVIPGNDVRLPLYMRNRKDDLSPLVGRTVQMRITGRNVKLYSFQFEQVP